jgi:hypothetical protein
MQVLIQSDDAGEIDRSGDNGEAIRSDKYIYIYI